MQNAGRGSRISWRSKSALPRSSAAFLEQLQHPKSSFQAPTPSNPHIRTFLFKCLLWLTWCLTDAFSWLAILSSPLPVLFPENTLSCCFWATWIDCFHQHKVQWVPRNFSKARMTPWDRKITRDDGANPRVLIRTKKVNYHYFPNQRDSTGLGAKFKFWFNNLLTFTLLCLMSASVKWKQTCIYFIKLLWE